MEQLARVAGRRGDGEQARIGHRIRRPQSDKNARPPRQFRHGGGIAGEAFDGAAQGFELVAEKTGRAFVSPAEENADIRHNPVPCSPVEV
jgi:hypothetical protein